MLEKIHADVFIDDNYNYVRDVWISSFMKCSVRTMFEYLFYSVRMDGMRVPIHLIMMECIIWTTGVMYARY